MTTEVLVTLFVAVAVLVGYIASKLRMPYMIAMVITGLVVSLAQLGLRSPIHLEPRLILVVFLPGLLFEASYHINLSLIRANLRPILILAFPGVILSTLITGMLLKVALDVSAVEALLFGVLISATDPVAVTSLLRTLGVDKRLGVILEGESLLNDGVSIVVFSLLVGVATGTRQLNVMESLGTFAITVLGGVLLGALAGLLISELMKRTEEPLIDLGLTVVLAYGTYLFAEQVLHAVVSPVIAVVVSGIIIGNYGSQGRFGATTTAMILGFWEFIVFLINSIIFLLIGLEVNLRTLMQSIVPVALAIAAILATRAVVVYALRFLINRKVKFLPLKWAHVVYWGGLRGAVSVALALSLPFALESRNLLITLTFGYVLFSLIIQGLTMVPLLRTLKLTHSGDAQRQFQESLIQMAAAQASMQTIDQLEHDNLVSAAMAHRLRREYADTISIHQQTVDRMVMEKPELMDGNARIVRQELAFSQRQALHQLLRRGVISDELYHVKVRAIDERFHQPSDNDWLISEDPT